MIIMPMTRPAASALSDATSRPKDSPHAADERRHRERGEEAQHDRGNAGQRLQDRLEDRPHPRAGILGQIDRREQAERAGHAHGDEGDQQRADQQRDETVGRVRCRPGRRAWPPAGSIRCRTGTRVTVGLPLMLGSKKNRQVSVTTEKTMPIVVRMAISAHTSSTTRTKRSNRLRARNEAIDARQDQRQGAERQRHADSENGPGAYRMHARIGVGRLAHDRVDGAGLLAGDDVADVAQRDALASAHPPRLPRAEPRARWSGPATRSAACRRHRRPASRVNTAAAASSPW